MLNSCYILLFFMFCTVPLRTTWCRGVLKMDPICFVLPLSQQIGVLTAFPQRSKTLLTAEVRAVQSPATLCARCVGMLKINAAAWRLHSVLDNALWERSGLLERRERVVGAPRARCKDAV